MTPPAAHLVPAGRGSNRVPLRLDELHGEQAAFVPRYGTWVVVGRGISVAMISACLVGAWLVRDSSGVGAGALVVAGLVLLGFLVRSVLVLPFDGGVWLGPSGLTHRWRRTEWQVAWSDVEGAQVEQGADGVDELDVRVLLRSRETRTINTHLLVLDPIALAQVVQGLAGPQSQGSTFVGSEAHLRDIETVRSTYVPSRFVVRGASRVTTRGMFAAMSVLVAVIFALAALGRHNSLDRGSLEVSVRNAVAEQGVTASDVSCKGAILKKVGETQDCDVTADGRKKTVQVRVTAVDGDQVSYSFRER